MPTLWHRWSRRAPDGDDVAYSELVDLDGDLCYGIAYRILRDVDRAQDADSEGRRALATIGCSS
jgi:hypothetical protein